MKLRITLIIAAAIAVLAGLVAFKMNMGRKAMAAMAANVPPPPSVATTRAVEAEWSSTISTVASLQGSQSIQVATELAGVVRLIAFESGAEVKAGDLLVELDSSTEQAQLKGLEAAARLAAINLQRASDLRAKGTNSQSDYDAAEAMAQQAAAAADQVRALIAKKRICAPFPGRLGIRRANLGEYLAAGAAIVQLENDRPVYADFGIPQSELSLVRPGQAVTLRVDSHPGRDFPGKIEAVSPRISDSTRNASVRAVLDNADGALRGGMFGTLSLSAGDPRRVLVLPATSIVFSSYGSFVYVVEAGKDGTTLVRQQAVATGDRRGDQVAVTKGLKAGDEVVSVGQMKLRSGIPVRVNNQVQPDNSPTPTPAES